MELLELTKDTIRTMDMNTINQMLEIKWISPITSGIDAMPSRILDELANSIKLLERKYATRLVDVHTNINNAASSLAALIDDLTGNQNDMAALQELKSLLNK